MLLTQMQTRLRAADEFDKLDREQEQAPDRKVTAHPNPRIREFLKGFQDLARIPLTNLSIIDMWKISDIMEDARGIAIPDQCTEKEVQQVAIALEPYQNMPLFRLRAGLYLSLLINRTQEDRVSLSVHGLEDALDCLGTSLEGKTLEIRGNVGVSLGREMKRGQIHLYGNSGDQTGFHMQGGEIIIEGNTGNYLGSHTRCGIIEVTGSAGKGVGFDTGEGTEIFIEGEYKSIHPMARGDIYHKGILVWRGGRQV